MRILAIETSTTMGSVAVCEDERPLAEVSIETGKRHGERLIEMAGFIMERLEMGPSDMEAYAVSIGPGSFTGLRTGLAMVKGLWLANRRPVVSVPSLMALAAGAGDTEGPVLAALDARKGEVFAALFKCDGRGGVERMTDDAALSPERLAELLPERSGKILVTGDGIAKYRDEIMAVLPAGSRAAPQWKWKPRASWVAALAAGRLCRGESDEVESLVPVYLRHSEAELALGRHTGRR